MRLEITAVAGVGAAPFPPTELSISVEDSPASYSRVISTGKTGPQDARNPIHSALSNRWPDCSFTVANRAIEGLIPGRPPLVNGAVVVVNERNAEGSLLAHRLEGLPGWSPPRAHAILSVRTGPSAGEIFPLHRGAYRIGRGRGSLTISDPTLSRHHGTLCVGEQSMTLTSAPGSSGFSIRRGWPEAPTASATAVKGKVSVEVGDLIQCGMSGLTIRLSNPEASSPSEAGQEPEASSTFLSTSALIPLSLPPVGGMPKSQWGLLIAGLLPLVIGVLFAWLTGSWMFLAFAGMGAVAVLIPLFGGAKKRRMFAAAVIAAATRDALRRSAAFPGADELLARAYSSAPATASAKPTDTAVFQRDSVARNQLALRLGVSAQAALLVLDSADSGFTPPCVSELPVTWPLTAGELRVCGPSRPLGLLLNFVLMQLDVAGVPAVVLGSVNDVPLSARFLPRTRLATSSTSAIAAIEELCSLYAPERIHTRSSNSGSTGPSSSPGTPPCVLVAVNESALLVATAFPGLRVVSFSPSTPAANAPSSHPTAEVIIHFKDNGILAHVEELNFIPDGVPGPLFDRYTRARAQDQSESASLGTLSPCSLPLSPESSPRVIADQWSTTANTPLSPVPIGRSLAGTELFDFSHDGPHLLVGGTTGSGKSEFLRTLVGSLAAAHSPADLQFLFVDFKGGAGLGTLQKIPHTTSLVTDLNGHSMERTLTSLRAEIHLREERLNLAQASDSDEYRAGFVAAAPSAGNFAGMAHLIIVIDEFRVLVDQFPEAMAELMRIAAVGRSLGIHLVMATQRPQGAINADIRANVTSSVCLRVQTTFDSQDVIGTGVAAAISVDNPGRAFISRAGNRPTEFQSATLRLPAARGNQNLTAELVTERLAGISKLHLQGRNDARDGQDPPEPLADSDVASVAVLLQDAWQLFTTQNPSAVAAPPIVAGELPTGEEIHESLTSSTKVEEEAIFLGLLDVPAQQRLEQLYWSPEQHSHVACIGPRSGSSSAVGLFASQLLAANRHCEPPHQRFLYLFDGDGSLTPWSSEPWVGSHVTPNKLRTAVHLIKRLTEVAPSLTVTLVLCISDWGRWVAAFRSSPWPWAEDLVGELVRDTKVTLILGGERELLTAPFMSGIFNRILLPFGASPESRLLWPRIPAFTHQPGRAAIFGAINSISERGRGDSALVGQLVQVDRLEGMSEPGTTDFKATASYAAASPPLSVKDLPVSLTLAHMKSASEVTGTCAQNFRATPSNRSIVIGMGGDGGTVLSISVPAGMVLPVLGGPGTGKSMFLSCIKSLNPALVSDLDEHTSDDTRSIICVDNPSELSPAQLIAITEYLSQGKTVLLAASNHLPSLSRLPLEWGLRSAEQGIVLRPNRYQDGELFGIRVDTSGGEPPGRAVFIDKGRCDWFQFPQDEKEEMNKEEER